MLGAQLRSMLLFLFRRIGRNTLFILLSVFLVKHPFLCTFSSCLYERKEAISLLSCLMIVFPVTLLFFWDRFHLLSIVLSYLWNVSPCFWHWVDQWWHYSYNVFSPHIMWAEVAIHSTRFCLYLLVTIAWLRELAFCEWGRSQTFRSLLVYSFKNPPIEVTNTWRNNKRRSSPLLWGQCVWRGCHASRPHNNIKQVFLKKFALWTVNDFRRRQKFNQAGRAKESPFQHFPSLLMLIIT